MVKNRSFMYFSSKIESINAIVQNTRSKFFLSPQIYLDQKCCTIIHHTVFYDEFPFQYVRNISVHLLSLTVERCLMSVNVCVCVFISHANQHLHGTTLKHIINQTNEDIFMFWLES